jgi:hypothetical protein
MIAAATWPFHWWRFPGPTEKDMEWFENQCPGWHAVYGEFWAGYNALTDPAQGMIPLQALPSPPPLCKTCMMPCAFPHPGINSIRIVPYNGKPLAFCSYPCEEIFNQNPTRYLSMRAFDDIFHGVGLDEYIVKNGLLRADGKTLVAQPHVRDDLPMWTIDDIRRCNVEIIDPLQVPPPAPAESNGAAS